MPSAQVRLLKLSGQACPAAGVLAVSAVVLVAACSSPKTAAAPAAQPGAAMVEPAGRSNPNPSDPGGPSDPFVAAVRAGTMSGYPQATIGQAFEAAFSDAHWSSHQPKEGVHVVTFTGFFPANARPECSATKAGARVPTCAKDAKVTFEWSFASGGAAFHLSRADPAPWPAARRSTREMMLYIYGKLPGALVGRLHGSRSSIFWMSSGSM